MVLVSQDGQSQLVSADDGMPIGVDSVGEFKGLERSMREGDSFALYSDGVSEARNKRKEEYGIERLKKMMAGNRSLPAREILSKTIEDLNNFMGKADQHDDITLIMIKVSEPDEKKT